MKLSLKTILLISLGMLTACSESIREASTQQIQTLISQKTNKENTLVWSAPELEHSQYRLAFYGYNTLSYRLKADKNQQVPHFRLVIDVNYGQEQGLKIRQYNQAKLADGTIIISENRRVETIRCQFYSTMNYACLYRDRAELEIKAEQLIAVRHTGLNLILSSGDQDYEQIDLPANYIEALLLAMQL